MSRSVKQGSELIFEVLRVGRPQQTDGLYQMANKAQSLRLSAPSAPPGLQTWAGVGRSTPTYVWHGAGSGHVRKRPGWGVGSSRLRL